MESINRDYQLKFMRFLQLLANTVVFVLKILLLLFVFFIAWSFIGVMVDLNSMTGEIPRTLGFMLLQMLIFYFPLLKSLNALSLNSTLNIRFYRLVIIIFYLFTVVTLSPIIYQNHPRRAAERAIQSEAKQYVREMNRVQQSYFEENKTFAPTIDALGLGIKTETEKFQYSLMSTNQTAFHYAVSKNKRLKSYVGGVFAIPLQEKVNTLSILCRTNKPSTTKPLPPSLENGQLTCGAETTEVTN